ncbi:MAG: DUF4130 domain-containing protein, partial [Treponema sp.]|nr:DUF4130 domain-containing protein [Treponema sp.]
GLVLLGPSGEPPRLFPLETGFSGPIPVLPETGPDPWEDLWRNYHHAINNGDRKNPGLQRRFMPLRYWKYLPEMNFGTSSGEDPFSRAAPFGLP